MSGPLAFRSAWRAFLNWWARELRATLPAPLSACLGAGIRRGVLVPCPDGRIDLRTAEGRPLGRLDGGFSGERSGPLPRVAELRFSRTDVLRVPIVLPAAAGENLREVLSFELDRYTPFAAAGAWFDYRRLAEEAGELRVDLAVVPRALAEGALDAARRRGMAVDRAQIEGEEGRFNLLPPDLRSRVPRDWLGLGLAAAATVLAAILMIGPLWRLHATEARLTAAVAVAQAEAERVSAVRREVERLLVLHSYVHERREARPLAAEVLDEMTRALPDDTWLQQMTVNGRGVQLSGYSAAASGLVQALEGTPLFRKAAFQSPVARDPRLDAERFNLAAEIREARR